EPPRVRALFGGEVIGGGDGYHGRVGIVVPAGSGVVDNQLRGGGEAQRQGRGRVAERQLDRLVAFHETVTQDRHGDVYLLTAEGDRDLRVHGGVVEAGRGRAVAGGEMHRQLGLRSGLVEYQGDGGVYVALVHLVKGLQEAHGREEAPRFEGLEGRIYP